MLVGYGDAAITELYACYCRMYKLAICYQALLCTCCSLYGSCYHHVVHDFYALSVSRNKKKRERKRVVFISPYYGVVRKRPQQQHRHDDEE